MNGPTVTLSDRQRRVLAALSDAGEWSEYLTSIASRIDMPHRDVRNAARALTRKGLARREHLFDEATALTAGSTYVRTREGARIARELGLVPEDDR